MEHAEPSWLLCRICSCWREIALATPGLWNRVEIRLRDSAPHIVFIFNKEKLPFRIVGNTPISCSHFEVPLPFGLLLYPGVHPKRKSFALPVPGYHRRLPATAHVVQGTPIVTRGRQHRSSQQPRPGVWLQQDRSRARTCLIRVPMGQRLLVSLFHSLAAPAPAYHGQISWSILSIFGPEAPTSFGPRISTLFGCSFLPIVSLSTVKSLSKELLTIYPLNGECTR